MERCSQQLTYIRLKVTHAQGFMFPTIPATLGVAFLRILVKDLFIFIRLTGSRTIVWHIKAFSTTAIQARLSESGQCEDEEVLANEECIRFGGKRVKQSIDVSQDRTTV
ncbi:hypothetical protein OUZ56_000287 [Daphnia magna]|uniref:Uncharacterized protein n=1 Tax=Daphnia magna TaxID=35525 RepID=A0ABR0A012_9CRUS|nr:hypothetical protein OUZ56_000287 [Daphnia magna]